MSRVATNVRGTMPIHSDAAARQQTDVGPIPADWRVEKMGNLGQALAGLTYSPRDVRIDGVLVLRSSNVQDGRLVYDNNVYVRMDIPARAIVREGDILICVRNGSRDLIGKCARIDRNAAGMAFGAFMSVFRSPLNDFVRFAFQSHYMQRQIREHLGATINQITNRSLNSFLVAAPSTETEAYRIAEALSDADAFVESLEQLIAKKRQIKQGAMQELLTGKRRLPGFNGRWGEQSFGRVFDFYPTATNSRADLGDGGDTYYIHYGDLHTRFHSHLDFRREQPSRIVRAKCSNAAFVRNGDWIMADASEDYDGVGKSIEISGLSESERAVSGLHTFLLREKVATFVPGFKGHLGNLKSLHDQYMRVATGMKVFGVSKSALCHLVLPVPPEKEQAAIVETLSDMDGEVATLERKLTKARQIKCGMTQELLTGRIRLV